MRHVEGMPPFQAALQGSREVGFTIISISSSLIAVFIPIFFMPSVIGLLFHEFAVIVSLAIVASAFVSLTLVPMLASRFLTDRAHKAARRAGARPSAQLRRDAGGLRAHARRRAAPSLRGADGGAGHLRGDGLDVRRHPQRLLPGRTSARSAPPPRPRKTPPSGGAMVGLQDRATQPAVRADPNVAFVASFRRRQQHLNTGRMFITSKPRARTPADEAGGGRGCASRCANCRASRCIRPIQNLQLGGRPGKGAVPVTSCRREGRQS